MNRRALTPLAGWTLTVVSAVVALIVLAAPTLRPLTRGAPLDASTLAPGLLWGAAVILVVPVSVATLRAFLMLTGARDPAAGPDSGLGRVVRRVVARSAGVGVTASVVVGVAPATGGTVGEPATPTTVSDRGTTDADPPLLTRVDAADAGPLLVRVDPPTRGVADAGTGRDHGPTPDPVAGAATGEQPPPTVRMEVVDAMTTTTASTSTPEPPSPARRREPATPTPHPPQLPTGEAPSSPTAVGDDDRWVVRPGDHLWSVAEETLTDRWGRAPTAGAVLVYLERLVGENRSRLVDPANPDLIYPGQTFILPADR